MVRGDDATKERQASGLQRVERFLMALANRHPVDASTELSEEATYVVPGRSWVAGTFTGREEIVRHFEHTFDFAVDVDALKWVDWMVGTSLVAAVLDAHLQRGSSEFEGSLLFVFSFNPSVDIAGIRLFLEDQENFDLFFGREDHPESDMFLHRYDEDE